MVVVIVILACKFCSCKISPTFGTVGYGYGYVQQPGAVIITSPAVPMVAPMAAPMTDGQMSVLGADQTTSGAIGVDALTGRDDSNTMNMLSQLKTLIKSIGDKVENTIVIPEGCTIDITTTIDKQVLGKTVTPVVNTINNRNDLQANRKMAGQVP